jgi:hypothetical protein
MKFNIFMGFYFIGSGYQEVSSQMFCIDNGYSQDDIDTIMSLQVGEIWVCPIYGEAHTVKRIA